MTETFPWPIQNAAEWLPFWKGAGFFFATFILEDAATIGAGLLLATGAISWPVAFASCWLGIWFGDAGLYALARFGGRNWFERSRLKNFSTKVERSEAWFAQRGTLILIFSRCVPGVRLPTYLAAGFLRLPLPKFLLVTGAAAFVWTWIILWLAESLGTPLTHWLNEYKHGTLILLGAFILLVAGLHLLRRVFSAEVRQNFFIRLERWRHWEFWPGWLFYPPVALYCVWLAIKYRGASLPTISNPGIFSGGLVGESKFATLKNLMATSPEFTAEAAMVAGENFEERMQSLEQITAQFGYPFILKPDLGQRGAGVKLIRNREQAEEYLRRTAAPLVAQRYAPGPHEAGIFYVRFPHEPRGKIFNITEKVFPIVTGDGRRTLRELIAADPRARLIAEKYTRRFPTRLDEIVPDGQSLRLVEAGNHAQGCIFRDGAHLITPALEQCIDEISRKLDGFFIGRYDIRYASDDDLRAGKFFSIIELNGAAAEAAGIYDARNSVWFAYRTLFKQWEMIFAIGAENRRRGCAPLPLLEVWRARKHFSRLAATYPPAD